MKPRQAASRSASALTTSRARAAAGTGPGARGIIDSYRILADARARVERKLIVGRVAALGAARPASKCGCFGEQARLLA